MFVNRLHLVVCRRTKSPRGTVYQCCYIITFGWYWGEGLPVWFDYPYGSSLCTNSFTVLDWLNDCRQSQNQQDVASVTITRIMFMLFWWNMKSRLFNKAYVGLLEFVPQGINVQNVIRFCLQVSPSRLQQWWMRLVHNVHLVISVTPKRQHTNSISLSLNLIISHTIDSAPLNIKFDFEGLSLSPSVVS